jgi:hypothetical protein
MGPHLGLAADDSEELARTGDRIRTPQRYRDAFTDELARKGDRILTPRLGPRVAGLDFIQFSAALGLTKVAPLWSSDSGTAQCAHDNVGLALIERRSSPTMSVGGLVCCRRQGPSRSSRFHLFTDVFSVFHLPSQISSTVLEPEDFMNDERRHQVSSLVPSPMENHRQNILEQHILDDQYRCSDFRLATYWEWRGGTPSKGVSATLGNSTAALLALQGQYRCSDFQLATYLEASILTMPARSVLLAVLWALEASLVVPWTLEASILTMPARSVLCRPRAPLPTEVKTERWYESRLSFDPFVAVRVGEAGHPGPAAIRIGDEEVLAAAGRIAARRRGPQGGGGCWNWTCCKSSPY